MSRQLISRISVLLFVSGVLICSGIFKARAATPQTLLIGEVNWAGSSHSTVDEWIELWNRGNEPTDLNGYRLVGAGGGKDIVFDANAVIPPLSAFLISNYTASDTKSGLATDPQIVTSTISLPNDKLLIQLFDPSGTIIDQAGDGGTPPAGFSSSTKASMIRLQDGTWQTAIERLHIDDGVADLGTPGFCDGCNWVDIPEVTTTEIIVTVAATTTVELPVEPPPIIAEVAPVEPVITTIVIQLPDFRLSKIFPAPISGKEWVEISIPPDATIDALNGWSLYDASGKILTIRSATSNRIEISSSRLNNSGDSVELHRPDGSVAERMTYRSTPRDAFWEKNIDATAWVLNDPNAEPATPIIEPEPETITTYAPSPPPIELPTLESIEPEPPKIILAKAISVTSTRIKATTKPKAITKPKTTAVKKLTPADRAITFDMLNKIEPNVRVVLSGVVATKPGILSKNQFVLLAADGRGLLVYGTSKQISPPIGATVRVAGTLQINDDGISLHLATKDQWKEIQATTVPKPRIVDFLSASVEDGWSLVSVTATVGEVKTSGVTLDLGDTLVTLHAKPVSGYRLTRLKQGDTVRVTGLVDFRGLDPILNIRSIDDIEIVKHAALATTTATTTQGLPDWAPFGAAGITVAITQGFKKLKKLRDDRRVEKLITRASTTYVSP
ncbi:MAG: lamin tail domain-containing protein [Candidatus Uhrbacteria bacterium]